jgi:hypothetical protein
MGDHTLSILMVATKPPYPPVDGGRLLMWHTIWELADRGHSITLVSPAAEDRQTQASDVQKLGEFCRVRLAEAKLRGLLTSVLISRLMRKPVSVVRHTAADVRSTVVSELHTQRYDVLHVEQIQTLQNVPERLEGPPIVLRCQNVESRLWEMLGNLGGGLSFAARSEAHKMRRYEAAALHRASLTIALTKQDEQALRELAGLSDGAIRTVSAPFPAQLPAGDASLSGEPAIVLMDGPWWPIRESTDWFVRTVWPEIRSATPHAHVHCFGNRTMPDVPGLFRHPSPPESSTIFARNAVLAVPLRIASGLRMKILESWARGIPVVATPEAARGLETHDGGNLFIAGTAEEFASAFRQITDSDGLRRQLVAAGRDTLKQHHDPTLVGDELTEAYRAAIHDR